MSALWVVAHSADHQRVVSPVLTREQAVKVRRRLQAKRRRSFSIIRAVRNA